MIRVGDQATLAVLRDDGPAARFLHLACHGRAGVMGAEDDALFLADTTLSPAELTSTLTLESRLAVVSACQSAVIDMSGLADEALSMGSILVGAGSACAIASLWPVPDLATAVLMARFYEELFSRGDSPPEALRRAQVWVRDLSRADLEQFLARHPGLEEEVDRRGSLHPAGIAQPREGKRPYAHPYFWAGFVAVGA